MFTFMHKYRVAILSLMLLSLVGFGAWGAIQGLVSTNPEDVVMASYAIPGSGELREVKGEQYYTTARHVAQSEDFVKRYLGVGDEEVQLLTFDLIVLADAGRAAGIVFTDQDVRGFLGLPEDDDRRIPEGRMQFARDLMTASVFRSEFLRAQASGGWKKIYERYRTQFEELRGRYVLFERPDPTSFDMEIGDEEQKRKLQKWWDEDSEIQRMKIQKRVPEEVDLEVVWVRFQDKTAAEINTEFRETWLALSENYPVSEEEIQARWTAHQDVYRALGVAEGEIRKEELRVAQDAEDRAAAAEGREPVNLSEGDNPVPFDLVKERIRQELVLGKILQQVWIQAHDQGAPLEGLAAKYGLKHAVVKELDRVKLQTHPDFGTPRVNQMIFNSLGDKSLEIGQVATYVTTTPGFLENIFDEPGSFLAVFRVADHRQPRDAELDDVIGWAVEQWREAEANSGLKKGADDFRTAVDEKVAAVIADKKAEWEAERDRKVADEIVEKGLDREKEEDKFKIVGIESRENREYERKLGEEKAKHEAAAFVKVAEEQGLEVHETDWITKGALGYPQFPEGLDRNEKLRRLWRHQMRLTQLGATEPGRMGPTDVEAGAGLAVVTLVDEKREPGPEEMYRHPRRVQTIRGQVRRPPARDSFRFETFKNAEWFSLTAEALEKELEADRKRAADREARRQARLRARQQRNRPPPVPPTEVKDDAATPPAEDVEMPDAPKPPAPPAPGEPTSRPGHLPPGPEKVGPPPPEEPKK